MTEQEQVRFIAEKIMNWVLWSQRPMEFNEYPYVECRDDELIIWPRWGSHGKTWDPRTSISDAFQVVEKMRELGWWFMLDTVSEWHAQFGKDSLVADEKDSLTCSTAICLAAIEAVQAGDAR